MPPTSSFLTGIIVIASSFLLGAFFTHWVVDYHTFWTPTALDSSILTSLGWYTFVANAPSWYSAVLGIGIACGIGASAGKVALSCGGRGGSGGSLFDAASFLLLCSALTVYTTSISYALHSLVAFLPSISLPLPTDTPIPNTVIEILGSMAASHLLIAISLTGVISLQGGQAFSDRD